MPHMNVGRWFPIECAGELARDIREHNERVARDVEAARERRMISELTRQEATSFGCGDSYLVSAELAASSPLMASDESDAEYRKRCVRSLEQIDTGPSEYSPVATEAKPQFMPDNGAWPVACGWGWGPAAKPPVRDYCAETAAKLAAIDATVTLPRRPQNLDGYRVAPWHEVKAGQAVSVDAAGFVRAVSSVAELAAQDAARVDYSERIHVPFGEQSPRAIRPPPSREDERRAIDAMLRDDARRTPAFATARKAAVLAYCENHRGATVDNAATMLAWCRGYEERRGGMGQPAPFAVEWLEVNDVTDAEWTAMGCYERARGMR